MDILRHNVKDIRFACASKSTRLLRNIRKRSTFIKQTKLSGSRPLVFRIKINTTIQEISMEIGDEGSHVATTVRPLVFFVGSFDPIDKALYSVVPPIGVRLVN